MALVFCDGFDHYDQEHLIRKWDSDAEGVGEHAIITNETNRCRREGTQEQALISFSTWYTSILRKNLPEFYNGFVMGFAFWVYPGLSPASSPFMCVYDRESACIAALRCTNESGSIEIVVGSNNDAYDYAQYWAPDFWADPKNSTQVCAYDITEAGYVKWATWHHIEWKVVFHATAGSYEVRIDEVEVIKETGINTIGTEQHVDETYGPTINSIAIGKDLHQTYMIDDYFLLDLTGSSSNDFIGDCRVDALYTNANGYYTQFNPVPNTNPNWVNTTLTERSASGMDEQGQFYYATDWGTYIHSLNYIDNSQTYNETFIPARETYNMDSIVSLSKPIHGIQQNAAMFKTDAGKKEVTQLLRTSSTDYESDLFRIQDHIKVYTKPYTLNPYTSSAWTEADINALESGIRVVT